MAEFKEYYVLEGKTHNMWQNEFIRNYLHL